jgi:hypothetical protein
LLFAYNFPSYKTTVFYVVYMYKDFITHWQSDIKFGDQILFAGSYLD